jgi:hypothetical protein
MSRVLFLALILLTGCTAAPRPLDPMFGPATMRLNPTFTRVVDNRLSADVELLDAFGDLTKGAGSVTLALHLYEEGSADVRGDPAGEPVRYDLSAEGAQERHWQGVVRTYRFTTPWRRLEAGRRYVLSATYEPATGGRLFDRIVLTPRTDPS